MLNMNKWSWSFYQFFAVRRALLAGLAGLFLLACLWLTSGLNLDKSLTALLPSDALRQSALLLDLAPFARVMVVQLSAEEDSLISQLPAQADNFIAGLDPVFLKPLDLGEALPNPMELMSLLPALCDDVCRLRLSARLNADALKESLANLKQKLAGLGNLEQAFWRLDPLALRSEIFRRFPFISSQPIPDPLSGYCTSPDNRHILLFLEPAISMNDTTGAAELMANINSLVLKLPSGISAQIIGAHRYTAANAKAIEHDLQLTLSLAFGLILLIYLILVRSWGAIWLFLTPAVAVLVATAGLIVFFNTVSGLALGFGAAVLGIAEDYAVHTHFALRRARDKKTALEHIARPLLMSMLLCTAGFAVLMFSAVPAIGQLAFFSALAIVVGYFWAIVVLPHCPAFDKPREIPLQNKAEYAFAGGGLRCWLVFSFFALLSALLLFQQPFVSSVRDLGLVSQDVLQDQQQIEEIWHLNQDRKVYLAKGEDFAQALLAAGQAVEILNQQSPDVASSLATLLPPLEQQKKNMQGWRDWPERLSVEKALLSEAYEQGFALQAFQPFWAWFLAEPQIITPDTLRQAGLKILLHNYLLEKDNRYYALVVVQDRQINLPSHMQEDFFELSAPSLEKTISEALSGEKILLPFVAVICLAILIFAFKNISQAVLAFVPALGGLCAVLLWHFIAGRPLGLVEAAALPLIICLGADYGIVVISELKERADLGAPKAIVVSGLSTIAGVGILVLAVHPVLHALGKTVFVGLLAAMPISIWLIPYLYGKQK